MGCGSTSSRPRAQDGSDGKSGLLCREDIAIQLHHVLVQSPLNAGQVNAIATQLLRLPPADVAECVQTIQRLAHSKELETTKETFSTVTNARHSATPSVTPAPT